MILNYTGKQILIPADRKNCYLSKGASTKSVQTNKGLDCDAKLLFSLLCNMSAFQLLNYTLLVGSGLFCYHVL